MNEKLFWSKVNIGGEEDCWMWTGSKDTKGYGKFGVYENKRPKSYLSHRLAYALKVGNIPSGLCVCHRCDNPLCCNPKHLFLGTKKDNTDDMMKKGRGRWLKGESHPNSKLTEKDIDNIFKFRRAGESTVEISWRFGVSQVLISSILAGKVRKK